jgi:hypothetical protein
VGAVPLTLYTLHVTALALYRPAAAAGGVGLGTLLVVHLVVALAIGALLRVAGLRGPLEAAVGAVAGSVRRAVAAPARGDGPVGVGAGGGPRGQDPPRR